jgi:hypothetical protein
VQPRLSHGQPAGNCHVAAHTKPVGLAAQQLLVVRHPAAAYEDELRIGQRGHDECVRAHDEVELALAQQCPQVDDCRGSRRRVVRRIGLCVEIAQIQRARHGRHGLERDAFAGYVAAHLLALHEDVPAGRYDDAIQQEALQRPAEAVNPPVARNMIARGVQRRFAVWIGQPIKHGNAV